MADRDEIIRFCNELLASSSYQDAAHNGLQIEGTPDIQRVAVAVSCNQNSVDAAVEHGADALLVHHGLIWGDRIGPVHGPTRHRLRGLLANDINLIAYHLPLDGHPEVGNNAQIIEMLGLKYAEPFAEIGGVPIGQIATATGPQKFVDLVGGVMKLTGQEPIVLNGEVDEVSRVAVVSGSGYPTLDEAAAKGCDVLLTGDVREPTMALARELGIAVLVAGHEATERLGVQALAERLQESFGIHYEFIPDPNPI